MPHSLIEPWWNVGIQKNLRLDALQSYITEHEDWTACTDLVGWWFPNVFFRRYNFFPGEFIWRSLIVHADLGRMSLFEKGLQFPLLTHSASRGGEGKEGARLANH